MVGTQLSGLAMIVSLRPGTEQSLGNLQMLRMDTCRPSEYVTRERRTHRLEGRKR